MKSWPKPLNRALSLITFANSNNAQITVINEVQRWAKDTYGVVFKDPIFLP